jgi:hypothetical protein
VVMLLLLVLLRGRGRKVVVVVVFCCKAVMLKLFLFVIITTFFFCPSLKRVSRERMWSGVIGEAGVFSLSIMFLRDRVIPTCRLEALEVVLKTYS